MKLFQAGFAKLLPFREFSASLLNIAPVRGQQNSSLCYLTIVPLRLQRVLLKKSMRKFPLEGALSS